MYFLAPMPRNTGAHIDSPAALGGRLEAARLEAGLSQRRLAAEVNCSPTYLSRIEAGARIPSLQLIRALAQTLGIEEAYLATSRSEPGTTGDPVFEAEMTLRLGDLEEAEKLFAALDAESNTSGVRARALAGRGQIEFSRGDQQAAIKLFESARGIDPAIAEDAGVADTFGRAYALTGEFELALSLFEARLAVAEQRQDLIETLRFLVLIANTLVDRGTFGRAEEVLGRAIALAGAEPEPLLRARLWWSQSRLHAHQNESQLAAKYARLALDTLLLTDHVAYAGVAHQVLAHIEVDQGRPLEALELFEKGYPLVLASGNKFDAAQFLLEKARALAQLGEPEQAAALALEAAAELSGASPTDTGRAYGVLAQVYETIGDPARAIEIYELAAETLPAADRYLFEIYSRLGELLRREGRSDEALEVLSRAVAVKARHAST
jgi:tetratricopeptide (TPR) repeat protein